MTYQIVIEGQTIPVPEEIGASDEAVKRALAPFYPDVANALVTRVTKDELTTITVVKRAGTKGARSPLQHLIDCKGGKNDAIALYEEIQAMETDEINDPMKMLEIDGRIEQAIESGKQQAESVVYAAQRLAKAIPQPAPVIVVGF